MPTRRSDTPTLCSQTVADALVQLLRLCPDIVSARKELLLVLRSIVNNNVRIEVYNHIKERGFLLGVDPFLAYRPPLHFLRSRTPSGPR